MSLLPLVAVLVGLAVEPAPTPGPALALEGEAAEAFLRTAEVVADEGIPYGVSRPRKLTLSDGTLTLHAVFKTIDEFAMRKELSQGQVERHFRDSWKHEVAAYELDKLLGLGMVPPTVERRLGDQRGSLQLWVEGAMTEHERQTQGLAPPDMERWNNQIHNVRLLHQLTYNTDYRNIRNLLVDRRFHVWVIDASRCFKLDNDLRKEEALVRFDAAALERLRGLTRELLVERLGRWLTVEQVKALLARRDVIVARADRLLAEHGAEVVLFR